MGAETPNASEQRADGWQHDTADRNRTVAQLVRDLRAAQATSTRLARELVEARAGAARYQHRDCDAAIMADNLAGACLGCGGPERLTLDELLQAVEIVDAHLDANTGDAYKEQPLALTWTRVTKVCEEAGEVWKALSKLTGENPRKGVCGTEDELLGELGDTASAAFCAIQHRTKDIEATWAVVSAALIKARNRVAEHHAQEAR